MPQTAGRKIMRYLSMSILVVSIATAADAQLTPDEVAVIAMARSELSRSLAEYYVHARGIPPSQIFLLEGEPGGTMRRAVWQYEARPAIRAWLSDQRREEKIRCLVTCWDVPLKIGRRSSDAPEVVAREDFLVRSQASLTAKLDRLVRTLDSLAPDRQSPKKEPPGEESLAARFQAAFLAAQRRLAALESEAERKRAGVVLERAFVASSGISGLLPLLARRAGDASSGPEKAPQLERLQGQLLGLGQGLKAFEGLPDTPERDLRMLDLIRTASGLIGAIRWVDQQRKQLKKNETYASFDSELSLLHWPDYPLNRGRPNLLHYRYDELSAGRPATLMVSRLEAPTYELAKKLIDMAIETEKTGLTGKVYLDARGIGFDPQTDKPGSYGQYDQSLRDLAERLKKHTKLEVVLDEKAKLFQEGNCPDAGLYCGWYSLAKYIDAFDWRPGAVGYHIASSEASTLRKPGGKVWCNAMLEDGISATLGPVHEPYLAAFPLPDDFFPLLLTGRYTLAEAYYRTKPQNSWAMVLVGDPLYNPFKNNPPLSEDALPAHLKPKPLATSQ